MIAVALSPFLVLLTLLTLLCYAQVEPGVYRRPLQNLVVRVYHFARWCQAVAEGLDQGTAEYYRLLAKPLPTPANEREVPPRAIQAPRTEEGK